MISIMHFRMIKLKSDTYLYVLIMFAIMSSFLRLTDNGMTSLYRLLGPMGVFVCLARRLKTFSKDLVIYIIMILYSTFVSMLFFEHIEVNQVVFTTYVFFLYILIKELRYRDKNFEYNFWRFIHVITTMTIVCAWFQHFVPYVLPYLAPPMKKGAMSVYFTNENELSAALSSVFVIYLYIIFFTKKKLTPMLIFNIISIPIMGFMNDAKLSLIGIIIAAFIFFLYFARKKGLFFRIRDRAFLRIVMVVSALAVVILFLWNPAIKTRDYTISIRDMIFDWIIAIFKGQATGGLSTYEERSSAIIYGFIEYFKTYGFGIGIGNSVYMISNWPQYIMRYAKSMHNIILQFIVELGYFALIMYAIIAKKIIIYFESVHISSANLLKGVFFIAIIFISSQSSVGFLSNYLELVVIIYVCLLDVDRFTKTMNCVTCISKKRIPEKDNDTWG